ncbi:MAG: hypothetical protein ACJ73S_15920 [Mycobacteriales bacterium]
MAAARWVGAAALMLVGVLLACSAVLAVFTRNQVLDTGRYVHTVTPLARDPAVRAAVTDRLTDEIMARADLRNLAGRAVGVLEAQGAPRRLDVLVEPVVAALRSYLRTRIGEIVRSDRFVAAWSAANRAAHTELVAVLTGRPGRYLDTDDRTVSVDLGGFLETVRQRLADRGLALVGRLPPTTHLRFTLFSSADLPKARRWTRLLDHAATWLPPLSLAALAGGVALAPGRRRGLLVAGVLFGGGMVALLAALGAGREVYLDRLPATVRSRAAAAAVYDTVLRYLVAALEALVAIAVLTAVASWLAGPGWLPRAARDTGGRVLAAAGRALPAAPLGPVPAAARRYRRGVELAAVVLAAVAAVALLRHGAGAPLWLAAGVAAVAVTVEILARVPGPAG